jgi:RNA polymerase sigma factor (sigma-70 family)
MPAACTRPNLGSLVRSAVAACPRDEPDADLLRRFAAGRDEVAFAAIVRRHGGLVLDVCRCVLRNEADAEDAFQATFLVLVKNARSLRKADALAAWLHGVAVRTARKALAAATRRRKAEPQAVARDAASPDDLSWGEVRRAVHDALHALSERYALARLLLTDAVNPTQVYGREIEFVGTIGSIATGVDGGTVPFVRVDGWDANKPYGRVFVHNVSPDFVGKVGDRVSVRGMVVEHGYGTLFLWCHRLTRQKG